MKKILRGLIFSIISLYLSGVIVDSFVPLINIKDFVLIGALLYLVNSFLVPIFKEFLPLGSILLPLLKSLANALILYVLTIKPFLKISVNPWVFKGLDTSFLTIPPQSLNQISTIILVGAIIYIINFSLNWISD